jgi:molybdopterin-guanine dinucleotide biosynthesis protein A
VSAPPRLLGAVLAGGRSSRYGSDKAAALVAGEPMARRVARVLAGVAVDVVLVSSRPVRGLEDLCRLADRVPDRGPLGGLHAALHEARSRALDGVLLLGCDLPLVTARLLTAVAAAVREAPAAAPARARGVEPLCAAYRLDVLPEVELRLQAPDRSLHALLRAVGCAVVDAAALDVPAAALLNVNTPADREVAEAALATGRARGALA